MAVIKKRAAAKKLGPICLGRNTIKFRLPNSSCHFSVHEYLLCANAKYFKQLFQKRRRTIEGECWICREDFDPNHGDIAFCRSACGHNIHERCIEKWKEFTLHETTTCPFCRRDWVFAPKEVVEVPPDAELDHHAVQTYVDWLYTQKLDFDEDFTRDSDEYHLQLLKAWTVSSTFQDQEFKNAIVAECIRVMEEDDFVFDGECVEYAYREQDIAAMQDFVLDVWLVHNNPEKVFEVFDELPFGFHMELVAAALRNGREEAGLSGLLEKFTGGMYEMVDA